MKYYYTISGRGCLAGKGFLPFQIGVADVRFLKFFVKMPDSVYKLNYNNHPIPYNSKFQIDIIFIVYKQIIRIVPFTHFKHFDVVLQSGFHGII